MADLKQGGRARTARAGPTASALLRSSTSASRARLCTCARAPCAHDTAGHPHRVPAALLQNKRQQGSELAAGGGDRRRRVAG